MGQSKRELAWQGPTIDCVVDKNDKSESYKGEFDGS